MKNFIKNQPIWAFFVLACLISWPSGYIGLSEFQSLPSFLTTFLNYLAKFGPSLAGCIVVYTLSGRTGFRELIQSLLDFKAAPRWYAFALLGPTLIWLGAIGVMVARGNPVPIVEWGSAYFVVLYILKHFFLGGGLGEELGWRGFMLPRLQAKHHALTASLILGFAWGLWHGPKFFVANGGGVGTLLLFTVYTIVLAIVFTWVYNGTKGNLFIATLFHATMNATNGFVIKLLPAVDEVQSSEIYVAAGWLIVAVAIIVAAGPRNLSWNEKVRSV